MSLVNSKAMLLEAQQSGYAVGAFNVENMEMMQAVVEAAVAENSPVILQTTPSTLKYANTNIFASMASALAEQVDIPIALHLDHGDSFELCEKAAKDGYTSLMIDGSKLSLEGNIELTHKVARLAKTFSIPPTVEAELGKLGGKEDDLVVSDKDALYTNPDDAIRFVEQTGIDSLAVAIGTAHGFYKGTPKLEFDLLKKISDSLSVPLVLHGSSGISDEDVKKAISLGICKVNFATELRAAYTEAVRKEIGDNLELYDPKKFGDAARKAVIMLVRHRITVCGSSNKVLISCNT